MMLLQYKYNPQRLIHRQPSVCFPKTMLDHDAISRLNLEQTREHRPKRRKSIGVYNLTNRNLALLSRSPFFLPCSSTSKH